jgi:hypothetical protein
LRERRARSDDGVHLDEHTDNLAACRRCDLRVTTLVRCNLSEHGDFFGT